MGKRDYVLLVMFSNTNWLVSASPCLNKLVNTALQSTIIIYIYKTLYVTKLSLYSELYTRRV